MAATGGSTLRRRDHDAGRRYDDAGRWGTTTPGGGTTTPGGGTTTPGGDTTTPGGGTATPAKLTVERPPPRWPRPARRRSALTLKAGAAGRVQLSLVRGGRVVCRGGTAVVAGTTAYKLKLPKGVKAGRYTIKATYTPAGGASQDHEPTRSR